MADETNHTPEDDTAASEQPVTETDDVTEVIEETIVEEPDGTTFTARSSAATASTPAARERWLDRRSIIVAAVSVLLLGGAFALGWAVGDHNAQDHRRGDRAAQRGGGYGGAAGGRGYGMGAGRGGAQRGQGGWGARGEGLGGRGEGGRGFDRGGNSGEAAPGTDGNGVAPSVPAVPNDSSTPTPIPRGGVPS